MAKKKGAEYISGKESRAITKENRRVTDVIEKNDRIILGIDS